MEVIISAKHYETDDALKALAEELADKLSESYKNQKLTSIRFVFSLERNWQIADALLNAKHLTLHATARTNDMRISLANVVDKLDKQLRRYLERIQDNAIKPDPVAKQKIWTSDELREAGDDDDLEAGYYDRADQA
ncbi:MAG: ribosome-associated translation inhibitor RaiA [Lentisphaeria bacterium]|jgi:putative sigma-54 modulation protein|nr:ribosome-associated translation inhibitor RaiA [Lentisphaeria bacterium]